MGAVCREVRCFFLYVTSRGKLPLPGYKPKMSYFTEGRGGNCLDDSERVGLNSVKRVSLGGAPKLIFKGLFMLFS